MGMQEQRTSSNRGKVVSAAVGVAEGGIAINWSWLGLEQETFKHLLNILLLRAGFPRPGLVSFDRNGKEKMDWYRIRIPRGECELHQVNPWEAVEKMRAWLVSPEPLTFYGVSFDVE